MPTNSTRLPLGGHALQVLARPQQAADRLADVDDVDQVAAGVDVGPHLGVPAAGPMAEMDPGFNQVFYENGCQGQISFEGTPAKSAPRKGRRPAFGAMRRSVNSLCRPGPFKAVNPEV